MPSDPSPATTTDSSKSPRSAPSATNLRVLPNIQGIQHKDAATTLQRLEDGQESSFHDQQGAEEAKQQLKSILMCKGGQELGSQAGKSFILGQ